MDYKVSYFAGLFVFHMDLKRHERSLWCRHSDTKTYYGNMVPMLCIYVTLCVPTSDPVLVRSYMFIYVTIIVYMLLYTGDVLLLSFHLEIQRTRV